MIFWLSRTDRSYIPTHCRSCVYDTLNIKHFISIYVISAFATPSVSPDVRGFEGNSRWDETESSRSFDFRIRPDLIRIRFMFIGFEERHLCSFWLKELKRSTTSIFSLPSFHQCIRDFVRPLVHTSVYTSFSSHVLHLWWGRKKTVCRKKDVYTFVAPRPISITVGPILKESLPRD